MKDERFACLNVRCQVLKCQVLKESGLGRRPCPNGSGDWVLRGRRCEEVNRIEELLALLGTDDIDEAVRNLMGERAGMVEMHDENTALRIYNRRLRLVVDYALQVFELCERDLALFITPKAREMIAKSRELVKRMKGKDEL